MEEKRSKPKQRNERERIMDAIQGVQIMMMPFTTDKRRKRKRTVRKQVLGIAATIAISLGSKNLYPLNLGETKPELRSATKSGFVLPEQRNNFPSFFVAAKTSENLSLRTHRTGHHHRSRNANPFAPHRRDEETAFSKEVVVPQGIWRVPSSVGGENHSNVPQNQLRGISAPQQTPAPFERPTPAPVSRPTPAPVSRPTPAPVSRPTPQPVSPTRSGENNDSTTTIDMNQQSTILPWEGKPNNSQWEETISPMEPMPWEDETEEESQAAGTNEETTANGDNDRTEDGDNKHISNGNEEVLSRQDFCEPIRNQNHTAILAKEQEGEAGPSFLFSVTVTVVHEEALVASEAIPGYLDVLNVPIALSVADCQDESERRLLTKEGKNQRVLQSDSTIVEYSEVEAWREFTASAVNDGCSVATQAEGFACGNYRSRVIVFLVDGEKSFVLQEEYKEKTNQALQTHQALVSDIPGVAFMQINSIAPVGSTNESDGLSSDTTIIASSTSSGNRSVNPLSDQEIIIAGSVAAGIGGLFLGLLCMLYTRRSSRCNNCSHKHSRFTDDENISEDPEEWSPPKVLPNQNNHADPFPYSRETVARFPSFEKIERSHSFPEEEELKRNLSLTHRGDSYRKIYRTDSLLDSPNKHQPMSVELRRAATLQTMRNTPTVTWSFDDEYGSEDGTMDVIAAQQSSYLCCSEDRPCSSATCAICENRRASGIGRGEYLWLRELLPASPPRIDTSRPCFCSDTVQL